jgi:hypothetical protein
VEYIINYNNWKQIYESVTAQETIAKEQLLANKVTQLFATSIDGEYWIDLAVDAVSGLIDLIPLIGTAISGGVDIIHALSYIFRAFLTSTTTKKIEYVLLGAFGLGTSFIPVGGNLANAAARIGISNALKLAPKVLTKVPLIKKSAKVTSWANSTPWKFDLLTVIISHFRNKAITFISEILAKLETAFNKIIPLLREYVDMPFVGQLASSLITGIKNLYYDFTAFNSYAPIVLKAIDKVS